MIDLGLAYPRLVSLYFAGDGAVLSTELASRHFPDRYAAVKTLNDEMLHPLLAAAPAGNC